jgi:hypothetical protein
MSLKSTLFGDKPSIKNVPTLSTEQKDLLNAIIAQLQGTAGTGVEAYPGDIYAGASGLNQELFDLAGNILSEPGQGQDILDQLLSQFSQPYTRPDFDPSATIDMFNTSVRTPALKEFNTEILPGIAERYAGMNAGRSGAMLKTMADAGSDLESSLSGQLSQYLYNAENQNVQDVLNYNQLSSGVLENLMGTAFDQPLQTLSGLMGIAGTEQTIDQNQLTEDYQKWMYEQPYNNPWLQQLQTLLGTQTTQPVVSGGSSGLLSAIAPLFGTTAVSSGITSGMGSLGSGTMDFLSLLPKLLPYIATI